MPLRKETLERIEREADKYASSIPGMSNNSDWKNAKSDYIEGATAEATRSKNDFEAELNRKGQFIVSELAYRKLQSEAEKANELVEQRNNYYEDKIDMLNRIGAEKDKEIENMAKFIEKSIDEFKDKDTEVERLKGLIKDSHYAGWYNGMVNAYTHDFSWQQFKTENQL